MLRQAPTRDDLVKELGPQGLKRGEKTWTYDVPTDKRDRFLSMVKGYRHAEAARSQAIQESFPVLKALDRNGRPCQVRMTDEAREDRLARLGKIKARVSYGGARCLWGEDGLKYRRVRRGIYECTGQRQAGMFAEVVAPERVGQLVEVEE